MLYINRDASARGLKVGDHLSALRELRLGLGSKSDHHPHISAFVFIAHLWWIRITETRRDMGVSVTLMETNFVLQERTCTEARNAHE